MDSTPGFQEKDSVIEELLDEFWELPLDALRSVVEYLEATGPGQAVVKSSTNRKPYVVLKPTKDEYLQRCEIILTKMRNDPDDSVCQRGVRILLPAVKFLRRITEHLKNGQITYFAAKDLNQRFLATFPLDELLT